MVACRRYRKTIDKYAASYSVSLPKIFFAPVINSSSPKSLIVSLYPLSDRQWGHDLVKASGPENHKLTHSSQPRMDLQHRANTTGGFIGATLHILHIKLSFNNFFKPRGTFRSSVRLTIDSTFPPRTCTSLLNSNSSSSVVTSGTLDVDAVVDLRLFLPRVGDFCWLSSPGTA